MTFLRSKSTLGTSEPHLSLRQFASDKNLKNFDRKIKHREKTDCTLPRS